MTENWHRMGPSSNSGGSTRDSPEDNPTALETALDVWVMRQMQEKTDEGFARSVDVTNLAVALYSYQNSSQHGLNFESGDKIHIVKRWNCDWWEGHNLRTGEGGLFHPSQVGPHVSPLLQTQEYLHPADRITDKYHSSKHPIEAPSLSTHGPHTTSYSDTASAIEPAVVIQQSKEALLKARQEYNREASVSERNFHNNTASLSGGASPGLSPPSLLAPWNQVSPDTAAHAAQKLIADAELQYKKLQKSRDDFVAAVNEVDRVLPHLPRRDMVGYGRMLRRVHHGARWLSGRFLRDKLEPFMGGYPSGWA